MNLQNIKHKRPRSRKERRESAARCLHRLKAKRSLSGRPRGGAAPSKAGERFSIPRYLGADSRPDTDTQTGGRDETQERRHRQGRTDAGRRDNPERVLRRNVIPLQLRATV